MGHLKTPSVVPSSVETSPALKQPASPGGILEPMWVVKLFELCAPVVKTTTKAASESRVTSNTRIEERGKPQVWASHPAKCDGTWARLRWPGGVAMSRERAEISVTMQTTARLG